MSTGPTRVSASFGDVVLRREADGIYIEQFDERIGISTELLDEADPELLSTNQDGTLEITGRNMRLTYQPVSILPEPRSVLICERVE